MHSDPIADLLTRIRNALTAKHRYVDVNLSKMNLAIIEVLKEKKYVNDFLKSDEKRLIRVFLRYDLATREPKIRGLKRASKPSLRRYVKHNEIPRVLSGLGTAILSTPKGVVDGKSAKSMKAGGELLCTVW